MEILVWVCAGLSVLCGAGAALCQNLGRWLGKFVCKTSASVLFCMTAVLALARSGNWADACPIFAALVLGLVGDICLACPRLLGQGGAPQQVWLAFGLVCHRRGDLPLCRRGGGYGRRSGVLCPIRGGTRPVAGRGAAVRGE